MSQWSQVEAMDSLDPLLDDIDAICRGAHALYRSYPADIRLEHDPRAEASCIYAHMLAAAERRITGRDGVTALDIRGLKLWVVSEAAAIRFKKMDEDGRSRNYPTKQAQAYDKQMQLPGLPAPPLNLVAGYVLDPTGTEVLRVQVARPLGKMLIDWCAAVVPASERVPGQRRWVDVTRQSRAL